MATKGNARPDPKDFQFCKQEKATLVKLPGSINGLDFILEDLTDCKVYLLDHSSQVQIDNCIGCEILIGPVDGPAFFRDCRDCKVAVACRQLRTRDCHNVDVSLHVATDPIIESSSGMRFCPWIPSYPEAETHFKAANLHPGQNKWEAVYDFTPPVAGEAPHWSVLAEAEQLDWTVSTSSIVSKNGQGDAQTEAPTERSKESASEAPDGATCQPMGRGHVSVTSQPEPEGPNSDVGNGAQNTVSSENDIRNGLEVSGSDGAGTSVKDGVPAVKGGVPAELQRTEPELSVGETTATESGSMVKPDAGRAAASEGVLTDEGGNPVAKENVAAADESRADAARPKLGVFGLLVRSVRRLLSRLARPWRTTSPANT